MSRPELGQVVNIEDTLTAQDAQALAVGLLGHDKVAGCGGDLRDWYGRSPAHEYVRLVSKLVLAELRYRPTRRPEQVWFHLGMDAWRVAEDNLDGVTTHTIPVGKDEPPQDHELLRGMAWAEVPLQGQVIISTTPETHEPVGSIVVSPGELFIAAANVRELAVTVPIGSVNMELSFDQRLGRYRS